MKKIQADLRSRLVSGSSWPGVTIVDQGSQQNCLVASSSMKLCTWMDNTTIYVSQGREDCGSLEADCDDFAIFSRSRTFNVRIKKTKTFLHLQKDSLVTLPPGVSSIEAEFYVGVNVTHGLFMYESQAPLKA